MSQHELIYVTQSLLASAFYYGVAGGLVGWAIVPVVKFVFRRARSLFVWR